MLGFLFVLTNTMLRTVLLHKSAAFTEIYYHDIINLIFIITFHLSCDTTLSYLSKYYTKKLFFIC